MVGRYQSVVARLGAKSRVRETLARQTRSEDL